MTVPGFKTVLVSAALAAPVLGGAAGHDPPAGQAPIDCPLHAKGVHPAEIEPGTRLVLIEFREGRLPQGPPEAVKIPKAELIRLVQGAGFVLEKNDPVRLPYQSFLVFRRAERARP